MSDNTPTLNETLRDRILSEREKGNIVFWGLPGELMSAKIDDFVKQPAEGILYDLNRLEEICLTFLQDPKWVNDFAVALTIRKLKDELAATTQTIERQLSELRKPGHIWVPLADLEKIARGPLMPLPDPEAHSWRTYGLRAHGGLSNCMRIASEMLAAAKEGKE